MISKSFSLSHLFVNLPAALISQLNCVISESQIFNLFVVNVFIERIIIKTLFHEKHIKCPGYRTNFLQFLNFEEI